MLVNTKISESNCLTTFSCDGKGCPRELVVRTMNAQSRGPMPIIGDDLPGWLRAALKRRNWSSQEFGWGEGAKTFCADHTIDFSAVEEVEEVLPPAQQRKADLEAKRKRAETRREKARLRQKNYLSNKTRSTNK